MDVSKIQDKISAYNRDVSNYIWFNREVLSMISDQALSAGLEWLRSIDDTANIWAGSGPGRVLAVIYTVTPDIKVVFHFHDRERVDYCWEKWKDKFGRNFHPKFWSDTLTLSELMAVPIQAWRKNPKPGIMTKIRSWVVSKAG